MEKFAAVLLVLAFAAVKAQGPPHRCVAPPFFQGGVVAYDHETGYYRLGRISYDAEGERVRIVESVDENATRPQYDELVLHREKKRYVVDLKTRKCNVTAVNYPFHRIEIGGDSRFYGQYTVGLPSEVVGSGLRLGSWYLEVHDTERKIAGNFSTSFSYIECIPISALFYGKSTEAGSSQVYHYHRSFYDVTVGLDDPNIFHIPPECHQRQNNKLNY